MRETHVSYVFCVGSRAYKLKKPVTYDFVDQSTRAARERICHREVELNRRLAPDVYLGVLDISDASCEIVDHLVEMRRMPDERRLARLVADGVDVEYHMRALARDIAAFHSLADASPAIAASAGAEHLRNGWVANLREIRGADRSVLDVATLDRVEERVFRYIDGRGSLFSSRANDRHAKDGHGDLLADDIFCLDDGPRVLDCIEFSDELRWGDVVADVAFLAMDLERLGARALAERFIAWYREFSGEIFPTSLADHYVAYRALIRSKVACLKYSQTGDPSAADRARALLAPCDLRLDESRIRLILVGGLPGTGKSTLAAGICDRLGYALVRSDEVRKDVTRTARRTDTAEAFGHGIYDDATTSQTYEEMLRRARTILESGTSVVLDASWLERAHRDAATALARRTFSDLVQIRCELDSVVAAERMQHRRNEGVDVSDGDAEIARKMAERSADWNDAESVATEGSRTDAVERALNYVRTITTGHFA